MMKKAHNNLSYYVHNISNMFSVDSFNIGKIGVVNMDTDTGDSPPVSQTPYKLPQKHAAWVQKELVLLQ